MSEGIQVKQQTQKRVKVFPTCPDADREDLKEQMGDKRINIFLLYQQQDSEHNT